MRRDAAGTVRLVAGGGFLLVFSVFAAACASDGPRPVDPAMDLHAPDANRRAQAVQLVAAQREQRFIPDLIELLDDRDETVRLQTGAALREMTGHDTGYRPFAPRSERQAHMAAWRAWWTGGGTGAPAVPGDGS